MRIENGNIVDSWRARFRHSAGRPGSAFLRALRDEAANRASPLMPVPAPLADINTVVTVGSNRLDGLLVPVEILGNPGRFYCNITPRDEADRLFDTLSDRNGMFPM